MPELTVIGGPNGSGKTTLTSYYVDKGRIKAQVVNPDEIALNEFGGFQFHIAAARVALERRITAIAKFEDLAFETTFSGNSEINEIIKAKAAGYRVTLYYVALKSKTDNIIRVEERRTTTGHDVDREDILRRYVKSQFNLIKYISIFDTVYLFDNSDHVRSRVAIFRLGELVSRITSTASIRFTGIYLSCRVKLCNLTLIF